MPINSLSYTDLLKALVGGAEYLKLNYKILDNLNIFPVPDGDTGTNMLATFQAGTNELLEKDDLQSVNDICLIMDSSLQHESRGNSGFIISRFFHGLFKILENNDSINARHITEGFINGLFIVKTALLNPVEGTMITIMASMCEKMTELTIENADCEIPEFLNSALDDAKLSLSKTPEMLPVLAKAGVIDSGALGFIFIIEGLLSGITGRQIVSEDEKSYRFQPVAGKGDIGEDKHFFQYCTELILNKTSKNPIVGILDFLKVRGDSIALIDEDIFKLHIHTDNPGEIIDYLSSYGEIEKSKIDDMHEQLHLASGKADNDSQCTVLSFIPGPGFAEIFADLGVLNYMLYKNELPSTGQILKELEAISEENIIVLPNNNNIMPAVLLAREKSEKNISIIPTKNVIEGITSTYGFSENENVETNVINMKDCVSMARSLFIYRSVSHTVFDGVTIEFDDYFAIQDKSVVAVNKNISVVVMEAIKNNNPGELGNISFYFNDQLNRSFITDIKKDVSALNEYIELEEHYGGQHREELIISME